MNVSQSEGFTDARRELRLVDHGGNGPADQVPLVGEPEGNHRLNVENVLHVVVRPHPEVDIVLERHRNEIRDGVLRLLGQVGVVLGPTGADSTSSKSSVAPTVPRIPDDALAAELVTFRSRRLAQASEAMLLNVLSSFPA